MTYQQSSQDALGDMDAQQRAEHGQQLSAAADQQDVAHGWDGSTDPRALVQSTTNVHQPAPDLLAGLLGGAAGSAGGGLGGLRAGGGASVGCSAAGKAAQVAAGTR